MTATAGIRVGCSVLRRLGGGASPGEDGDDNDIARSRAKRCAAERISKTNISSLAFRLYTPRRERERVICLFYAVIYRRRLRQRKKQKTRGGFAGRARRAPPGSAIRSPGRRTCAVGASRRAEISRLSALCCYTAEDR